MSAASNTRRQLRNALIALAAFAVLSVVGFLALGYPDRTLLEAMHITANIFSTVGAWKASLNAAEQVWEIVMIIFGIGSAAYALGSVTALITSGELQRTLGRRQLVDRIQNLTDHYIICGFGRMGQNIAATLAASRRPFVIIDLDDAMTQLADDHDYLYLLGDASDEQILRMASIAQAKGLVATLPHDADNVFVVLTARGMNSKFHIIARAEREETEPRLERAGADRVICPAVIGAGKITRMLLHPAVEDILEATVTRDMAIDRLLVDNIPGLEGQTLREAALPKKYNIMVIAIETGQGKRIFNPPADYQLGAGDQLIVIGTEESVNKACEDNE
jgi:voltage-gated potassium channel